MKKLLLIFLFGIILLSQAVLGANLPGDWWGKVEIKGVDNPNGAVVTAYLNNNSEPAASTTVGSLKSQYYLIHVPGEEGDNVTFRLNNISVEQDIQSWSKGEHSRLDLSVKIPESRTYSRASLNLTKGQTSIIDASNETNATLKVRSEENVTDATINVVKYSKNPVNKDSGMLSLDRYIGIEASPEVENNMDWTIIEANYTDEEVSNSGIEKNTLRLHYFNETAGDWKAYNPPKGNVNTDRNIVWANTTHFSIWGVFGKPPEEEGGTTGGGGGGMATLGTAANTTTTIPQENVTTTTVPSEEETTTTIEEQTSEEETSPAGRFLANPAAIAGIIVVLISIIIGAYLVKTGKIKI